MRKENAVDDASVDGCFLSALDGPHIWGWVLVMGLGLRLGVSLGVILRSLSLEEFGGVSPWCWSCL